MDETKNCISVKIAMHAEEAEIEKIEALLQIVAPRKVSQQELEGGEMLTMFLMALVPGSSQAIELIDILLTIAKSYFTKESGASLTVTTPDGLNIRIENGNSAQFAEIIKLLRGEYTPGKRKR